MDPVVGTLIGTVVGGVIGVGANLLLARQQRRAAHEIWLRDKLHESYREALRYAQNPPNQNWAERDLWLNMLMVYYPHKESAEYAQFIDRKERGAVTNADIVLLASVDARLQQGQLRSSGGLV
jgi:gas vesicle protein